MTQTTLEYSEQIEVQGIAIPFVPNIITPRIERPMRHNRYEAGECTATRKMLRPGDRVLELGGGVGLVSCVAAQVEGVERIVSVEANPHLVDIIEETHRINGVEGVELRNGVVSREDAETVQFYLRSDFWASSMEPDSRPYVSVVGLQAYSLDSLIEEIRPTVVIADIEGAELEIFDGNALDGVRVIIIELHPAVYGYEGQRKILQHFDTLGFRAEEEYLKGSVWVLSRRPVSPAARVYSRGVTSPGHNLTDPSFTVITCMKNEGPFIVEWIAYHKSIGVQDFVIFTNDCDDGTDLLLDRMDELGIVTHMPNPAFLSNSTYFQPLGLKYGAAMPVVRRADYVLQIDVDEFINIHVGDGTLLDLLKAAGPFHALSMSEVNFSSGGNYHFKDGWVTEQFREHETLKPGHWQARRGVKSILHGMDNFSAWPVHRPIIHPGTEDDLVWLDGSGRPISKEFMISAENGMDRRGCYDMVTVDHHPLRSAESFLVKHDRGDVVVKSRNVDTHYYRLRSLGGNSEGRIDKHLPRARAVYDELMQDQKTADLHALAVQRHKSRIREIENSPSLAELVSYIRENYFKDME